MKQIFLNSGTYTYKDLKGKLDLEKYILSVLAKDTCCAKSIVGSGSTYVPFIQAAAQTNVAAGGGAIPVTSYFTTINTDAGGDAFTLANGVQTGQLKKITLLVDGGGDATITLTGYTSIVMGDAADYVVLVWNGSAWIVIENSGSTINA